jgi:hypothetical protein
MIIVNGKKLDSLNKDEAFVRKIYEPQMKWLKSLKKKYFVFTFPDNKVRMDENGEIHTSNGSWVPFRQEYAMLFIIRLAIMTKTGKNNINPASGISGGLYL